MIRDRSTVMKGFLGLLAAVTLLVAVAPSAVLTPLNDTTRIEASQHVSNLPCGPGQTVQQCPGELECVQEPENPDGPDAFREDRVGVDGRADAYCVTPVFEQRYCGLFQPREGTFQSGGIPEIVTTCVEEYSIMGLVHVLQEDGPLAVIDRFIDTGGRGSAWIHEQNLTLLKDDPNSSNIPIEGYVDCLSAEAAITQVNDTGEEMTVAVENTGEVVLSNVTLQALYIEDTSQVLPVLEPGETIEHSLPAADSLETINLLAEPCGRLNTHELDG